MNTFIREINGFYYNNIHYGDRDSLYREKILGSVRQTTLVGKNLCQGKKDKSGGIF